jgi:hypothetical protein
MASELKKSLGLKSLSLGELPYPPPIAVISAEISLFSKIL